MPSHHIEHAIARRLTLVRLILDQAMLSAMQPGPLPAGIAISLCQDAIETALRTILEHWHAAGGDVTSASFDTLLSIIDKQAVEKGLKTISDRAQLAQLNKARVLIKHHGVLPDEAQARDLIFRTSRIAEELLLNYVGIQLDSFTLSEMVKRRRIRNHLQAANALLSSGDFIKCTAECGMAFALLFGISGHSDFAGFDADHWETDQLPTWGYSSFGQQEFDVQRFAGATRKDIAKLIRMVREGNLNFELSRFGIDIDQLKRFQSLVPYVRHAASGSLSVSLRALPAGFDRDDADFCVTFATVAVIRGQERAPDVWKRCPPGAEQVRTLKPTKLIAYPIRSESECEQIADVPPETVLYRSRRKHELPNHFEISYEDESCYVFKGDVVEI